MWGIVAGAAAAAADRSAPFGMQRKVRAKMLSTAFTVFVAGVFVGLLPAAAYGEPVVADFVLLDEEDISVIVAPGMNRQSDTLRARLVVEADGDYTIQVSVDPDSTDWNSVYMNDVGHHFISSSNAWDLGFDVAITGEGGSVNPPSVTACDTVTLGGWCMGSVAWRESVPAPPRTDTWDIHVRLVLVDEEDATAGYAADHDNVRFDSLPSHPDRSVNVMVVVSAEE